MLSVNEIRQDLHDIRYYYSRKDAFDNSGLSNQITEKVKRYNAAVRTAAPRLFDLYVCLYIHSNTQETVAAELGWSAVYVQKLHKRLLQFFEAQFEKGGAA